MANDIIFADGIKVRKINENFFAMSIKLDKFQEWIKGKETGGYINLNICAAKSSGAWYVKLNEWKPNKDTVKFKPLEEETGEEIPF